MCKINECSFKTGYDAALYVFLTVSDYLNMPVPGDRGDRGDPAEVSGGVTGRDPWMGVAWEDITEEAVSKGGEEGEGGHSRGSTAEGVKHLGRGEI